MAIKNLESLYDLVGNMGEYGGPVANMEGQLGPAFPIVGPDVARGHNPSIPGGSQLHGGPVENQAGRSLVGPAYQYQYGSAASLNEPSNIDLNGIIPDFNNDAAVTPISPLGPQQLPYNVHGPSEGFY